VVIVTDVEDGRLDEETIPVALWGFIVENTIRVLLMLPDDKLWEGESGSGYLAKISFLAVGEEGDESVLSMSNGMLGNDTAEEILAAWIDAEVRIVKGEPEPTPTLPADQVHNLKTSESFSFIQAAIDDTDTKDGHVIEVDDGIYYENVKVTKSLTIQSKNGSANCIVQATKANDNVFEVTVDYANIGGFTVKGALAMGKAGIYLNASHCSVSSNNCSDNQYGIRLVSSCNNTVSNNNCFLNNEDGISIADSSNNTLSDNNCSANKWTGICLQNSSNNTIFENNLSNNLDGIHLQSSSNNNMADNRCSSNWNGISFRHSRSSILSNNNCSSNSDYGIHLYESSDNNVISDNTCSSNGNGIALSDSNNNNISANKCSLNDIGIHLWRSSNNNAISNNTCFSNTNIGIRIYESSNNCLTCNNCSNNGYGIYLLGINNRIYLNNFINNTNNVHSYPNNIWNSPQKINYIYNGSSYTNYMGNYWSDYKGTDADNDGIGDIPYYITDRNDENYPLMLPFENYFASVENISDIRALENPYPRIPDTHNGTIAIS
jgi:parallel beta-helix repeat protein